jgi:serine/threonine protein kinase
MDSSDGIPPADLLPPLGRSGVLTKRQFEEVRAKVKSGEYPQAPTDLAERLVGEGVLTGFQSRRLLRNKVHGLVIDRYVILDRLGSGAMGRVFKAQHRLMGRVVALKLISPRIASRASAVPRFHREMRLVGRLDHPNVVRAFDADQVGEILFIVMEYVAGQSLDRLLQARGPLPPVEVADYMAQAALGLGHAHEMGMIHRDVKPSNLLVSERRQVKVLDLGLGALMEADSNTSFATAAGFAVGTVDFMSPEQATARDLDGRSDLFSLGCTLYYLLTGRLPFPGETLLECLARRIQGRPVPITEIRPDLPPGLVQVLDTLLARRPEDRFQTAVEAAEALWGAIGPGAVASPIPGAPPPQEPCDPAPELVAPPKPGPDATSSAPPRILPRALLQAWARLRSSLPLQSSLGAPLALIVLIIFVVGFVLGHLATKWMGLSLL